MLRAKRSLGQNFLRSRRIARLFAQWACRFHGLLLEVGPGTGALTREVLTNCPYVSVIGLELDADLIPVLQPLRLLTPLRLELLNTDALNPPIRPGAVDAVYGSIPYNITGPLLATLALAEPPRPAMLLLQKEVADRLAAAPGTKTYGRITVLIRLVYEVRLGQVVPPTAFQPRPKVYSRIVYLEPRSDKPGSDLLQRVEQLTRCMFSQRNRLADKVAAKCLGADRSALAVFSGRRVYELTPEDFRRLAERARTL